MSPTESYNAILPFDVVSNNQPGISHDSYLPDPRIPTTNSRPNEEYNNNNKDNISNMLHGMSFHLDEHRYQDSKDTSEINRRGPQ